MTAKVGRPRVYPDDNARKRAHATRKRTAKRGADIVENTPESSNAAPLAVRAQVIEEPAPSVDVPTPEHPEAGLVPEAGSESSSSSPTTTAGASAGEPDAPVLDPKTMVALTKGLFSLIALRGGEHWKVSDDEIEPIAEPMCRQASRIPIVAALGQNTADLILIGSTLGALVFMRAEQSMQLRKAEEEARRMAPVRPRAPIVELRPERGETAEVAQAAGGSRIQEVREPGEPEINLGPFRASG